MASFNKSWNCHLEGDEDEDEEDEEDEGEDEEEPGLDYLQKENLEVNVSGWVQMALWFVEIKALVGGSQI